MRARRILLTSLALVSVPASTGAIATAGGGGDSVGVSDATGTFTLAVPASWSDVLDEPSQGDAGRLVPNLTVAPDIGAYLDGTGEGADVLVLETAASAEMYTQEYLDALVVTPGCALLSPGAESSTAAMPRALVGTWQCGGLVLTIAWGATADDRYMVAASALTADASAGAGIVASVAYADGGGAPPTTIPVETAGITITDAGDPGTAVSLRRPRTVGARSSVTMQTVNSNRETVTFTDTGTVQSTEMHSTFDASGTYEVTNEEPDGAYAVRFTPSAIAGDFTTTDPQQESFTGGFAPLVGFAMETWYDVDGQPIGFIAPDGVAATEEQKRWMLLVPLDGFSLPVTPVGVGATWTADVAVSASPWFFAEVAATYRLDAVSGDRFEVSMSLTADASSLPRDPFTESMTGSYSRTMWLAGSLSQPGIELVIEETATLHGEFVYGAASDLTWNSRRTFTEVAEAPAGG